MKKNTYFFQKLDGLDLREGIKSKTTLVLLNLMKIMWLTNPDLCFLQTLQPTVLLNKIYFWQYTDI